MGLVAKGGVPHIAPYPWAEKIGASDGTDPGCRLNLFKSRIAILVGLAFSLLQVSIGIGFAILSGKRSLLYSSGSVSEHLCELNTITYEQQNT